IHYNLFQPAGTSASKRVPIIFIGPGWSSAGQTAATGLIGELTAAGFGVLTWDPRGFGTSGGEANTDSQDFEVRDVQKLIDLSATLPWVRKDRRNDPRMGMAGASYGGGIQLMTASADHRVDAIVPLIAWNDLPQALMPNGVTKLGWDLLLFGIGVEGGLLPGLSSPNGPETGTLAPQIYQSLIEGAALNKWTPDTLRWFQDKSTARYITGGTSLGGRKVPGVRAPTLLMQGTNDTLFPLNHAIATYNALRRKGVFTKMVFFCGGLVGGGETAHAVNAAGSSCESGGEAAATHTHARTINWFRHFLLGDKRASTGPSIEYQTQNATWHGVASLPAKWIKASGLGMLANAVAPTSGVATAPTPGRDGVRFPVKDGPFLALGIPRVTGTVTGVGPDASVFFRLLDIDPSGEAVVIDDQSMPMRFYDLSSTPQRFSLDIAGVAWMVEAGHKLVLEITTTTSDFASSRTPAVVELTASVSVPMALR
ncbi:MAG: alpha/beta fold hydrolase, partial [Actinomycetota bacterium]